MFKHKVDLMIKVAMLPFTEIEFYKQDFFESLARKSGNNPEKKNTDYIEIRKNIYRIIHRTQKIDNLDEIDLLLQKFYPKDVLTSRYTDKIDIYYMELITRLAVTFLDHRDGMIVLKYWESSSEENLLGPYRGINKVVLWNSMNRIFTTDLLIAAYFLENDMTEEEYLDGYHSQIVMEDMQLEQILKQGVAETHIHMNAGASFAAKWQNLMSLTRKNDSDYTSSLFKDMVVDKDFGLENYMKAAAFLRVLMADYLENYSKGDSFKKYMEAYAPNAQGQIEPRYVDIYNMVLDIYSGNEIEAQKYNFYSRFQDLKYILQISESTNGVLQQDDILQSKSFKRYRSIDTVTENILLFKALKYMRQGYNESKTDDFFNKIFWQYIRIKNEVFQCNVQGNLIKGLKNFQGYFDRSTELYEDSKQEKWDIILKSQLQNSYLKKLELRIAPGKGAGKKTIEKNTREKLLLFFQAYKTLLEKEISNRGKEIKANTVPAIGVIYHFIKLPDKYGNEKCWYNYDGTNKRLLYFMEMRELYSRQMEVINELRTSIPRLSEYIVGIDAADLENNTEPWVFAPIFAKARDSKIYKTRDLSSDTRIKTIGFTFHAGEDFRHILTGLRRIAEVVEKLKFHAGDRIGHGIVLGIDIDKWMENNRIVVMPRIEHMENLLWIWGLYKHGKFDNSFDIEYIEKEIMKQAKNIYGNMQGIDIYNLWETYSGKFEDLVPDEKWQRKCRKLWGDEVERCPYMDNMNSIVWNKERLGLARHCQYYLEKMNEPILVEVSRYDSKMYKLLQKIMVDKLSCIGITVETNPTSNTAIGELESIFEHYIQNLNEKGLKEGTGSDNELIITINTDNPSVFNTNITNEFSYIFYSLIEKGYKRAAVLSWIDKIRNYGMRSSFIDDRGLTAEERLREIEVIIDGLRGSVRV